MPSYRIGHAAKLVGVSADTMRRLVDAGRVASELSESGHRLVDGADLARFAAEESSVRPTASSADQSVRNRFLGIVTRVVKDKASAHVEIQAGPHRFVALITREAADELKLAPGDAADAVVKATSVGVERPKSL